MPPDSVQVFVVQEMQVDFTPAERFGKLVFLSAREVTPTSMGISPSNRAVLRQMQAGLTAYIPGVDYLLLAGSPVAIAWAIAFALRKSTKSHKLLKWDAQQRAYVPYILDISKLDEESEG